LSSSLKHVVVAGVEAIQSTISNSPPTDVTTRTLSALLTLSEQPATLLGNYILYNVCVCVCVCVCLCVHNSPESRQHDQSIKGSIRYWCIVIILIIIYVAHKSLLTHKSECTDNASNINRENMTNRRLKSDFRVRFVEKEDHIYMEIELCIWGGGANLVHF